MRTLRKVVSSTLALTAFIALTTIANADVTGDFKVTGSGYSNDTATVSGTVNNGAIQSKKTVVVDVTYDYSFVAEKTEVIPGETTTVTVFTPGKCVTGIPNTEGCYDRNGNPKAVNGDIWTGTWETSTITTEPKTVTQTFNGASGMTAITEPTLDPKGRLNPKGKVTGYNWSSALSIVPNADLVDATLVPAGYTVTKVIINSIAYTAYLKDATGAVIADTVMTGTLPVE